jgi:hypothetical protein
MKIFGNSTFLYGDLTRVSQHKARFKKNSKKKFFAADERLKTKAYLLYYWNKENVPAWAIHYHTINSPRLADIKTIKPSCLYSDVCRSVNPHLGMSKYKIAAFIRAGRIKDLKKF